MFDIQMKVITSTKVERRLDAYLAELIEHVPRTPSRSIVLYVLVAGENERSLNEHLKVAASTAAGSAPQAVSAIAIGQAFVDARGGPVQRELIHVAVNPTSCAPIDIGSVQDVLQCVLAPRLYPTCGGTTLLYLEDDAIPQASNK